MPITIAKGKGIDRKLIVTQSSPEEGAESNDPISMAFLTCQGYFRTR